MKNKEFRTPILLLGYNRPELTEKVFNEIRSIKPKNLFFAVDGPNKLKEQDIEKCKKTKEIINKIDWPCKVETRFLNSNLGCAKGVSSAITWFFSKVDRGIILEDDCLPDKSFFYFCDEMLSKYKNNSDIMVVAGTNLLGKWKYQKQSYHFTTQVPIWGWATWKRAWNKYSHKLEEINNPEKLREIKIRLDNNLYFNYIINKVKETLKGNIDSWGYRWIMTIYLNRGKVIIPSMNLISNIGFSAEAKHTRNPFCWMSNLSRNTITFPLKHPDNAEIDLDFHKEVFKKTRNPLNRLMNRIFYLINYD